MNLNSNFSFDPNENMFDGSSKKEIMLDYNFTIIVNTFTPFMR